MIRNLFSKFVVLSICITTIATGCIGCNKLPQDKVTIDMLVAPYSSSWLSTYAIRNGIVASDEVELVITESISHDEHMASGNFAMGAMAVAAYGIVSQQSQSPYKVLSAFVTGKGTEEARGVNLLFTLAGSNITSPEELVGKTIGIPGLTSSTASVFLGMLKNKYGISEDQLTLVDKANTILIELLRKGQIDVALLGGNIAPQAYYDDDFRVIWDLDNAFKEEYGEYYSPTFLLVKSEFYETNPQAVKAAYNLLIESRDYARDHIDELTEEYASEIGAGLPAEFYKTIQLYHSGASFDLIAGKTRDCAMAVFQLVKDRGIIDEVPNPEQIFLDW